MVSTLTDNEANSYQRVKEQNAAGKRNGKLQVSRSRQNLQANRCYLLVEKTDRLTRNHLIFCVIFKLSNLSLLFYCP